MAIAADEEVEVVRVNNRLASDYDTSISAGYRCTPHTSVLCWEFLLMLSAMSRGPRAACTDLSATSSLVAKPPAPVASCCDATVTVVSSVEAKLNHDSRAAGVV